MRTSVTEEQTTTPEITRRPAGEGEVVVLRHKTLLSSGRKGPRSSLFFRKISVLTLSVPRPIRNTKFKRTRTVERHQTQSHLYYLAEMISYVIEILSLQEGSRVPRLPFSETDGEG